MEVADPSSLVGENLDYVAMNGPIREIADETGGSPVDVRDALFACDDRVREGTLH